MKIPGAAYHELVAMYFYLPEDWPGCLWVTIDEGQRCGIATLDATNIATAPVEVLVYLRPGVKAADFLAAVEMLPREEPRAMGEIVTFDRSTGDLTFWGGTGDGESDP